MLEVMGLYNAMKVTKGEIPMSREEALKKLEK